MSGHGLSYVEVDDVSRTLAVFGFYVAVIGLTSYTLKEKLYLSDALIALLLGIAVGPIGWNLVNPSDWVDYNVEVRDRLTYELARIVIGIQVLFTGIALPKAYLYHAWESLTTLLLLVMTIAWLVSSAFIFALIPGLTFLEALCVGACVTPTDPVLANSVVKGRFAEKYIPPHVRNIIAAEAGANDGLGFPFIYLAIYLISRFIENRSIGNEIGWWVVDIWLYQIGLSITIGAIIGYIAMKVVKYAEQHNMIDHESFLAIGIGLTFLTLGLTGMLGSDDILACFIVGNAFTWDGWFLERTQDESFQDVIDSLLNTGIFIYIGAILPWSDFGNGAIGLSAWRLVVLAILILLFRRLPWVLLSRKIIPDLVTWQEAVFAGWFGPIGVGAVYYAQVGLRRIPEDRTLLREVIVPVVYFIVLGSVVVHGITIPIFKHVPKIYSMTLSRTRSTTNSTRDLSSKFKAGLTETIVQREVEASTNGEGDRQVFRTEEELMERGQATRTANASRSRSSSLSQSQSRPATPSTTVATPTSGRVSPVESNIRTPRVKFEEPPQVNPAQAHQPGFHQEIPESDPRGETHSYDEGGVTVEEGQDGRIHTHPS